MGRPDLTPITKEVILFDRVTWKHTVRKLIVGVFVGLSSTIAFAQTPVVNFITPSSGIQGSTLKLTVTGSGFTPTSTLLFSSDGILVKSVRVMSATSIEATVVLNTSAGDYTVLVPGSNGGGLFSIRPSTVSTAAQLQVNDFAGSVNNSGSSDGQAKDARFFPLFGASIDSGNLYVADDFNSTVRKISLAAGSVTTLAGKAGAFDAIDGAAGVARFGEPVGIWAQNDTVFVSDAYYDTIRSISANGNVTTIAGSASDPSGFADGVGSLARFRSPAGIWGDGTNLYVCDSLNFTIRKIVIATGQVTTLAGLARLQGQSDGVGTAAQFHAPTEVWGNGVRLYIADGNAIRQVTIATGEVRTLAGNAATPGYADGVGTDARFSFISGIWGDGANLFIADSGNHVIRKLNLQNVYVTTVAGLATVPGADDGLGGVAHFNNPAGIAGDGTSLYIADSLNFTVRQATAPASTPPAGSTLFVLGGGSGVSRFTSGSSPSVQAGYGTLYDVSGSSLSSGMAIIDFRDSGTLVSEAAFPLSSLIRSGRLSVEISASVNTGLAIVNPNSDSVTLTFYFTDDLGAQLYSSQTLIPANDQFTAFLDQPPFSPSPQSGIRLQAARTFTYTASKPIAVAAVRGLTNERGDFLMSALPVVSLDSTNPSPVMLPVYADGGGWSSQVVIINPTDSTITGSLEFFTQGSGSSSGTLAPVQVNGIFGFTSDVTYGIPPRSSARYQTSGKGESVQVGSVRLVPSTGSANPSAFLVVSYRSRDITSSEAIVPGISPNSSFSLYAERSGDFAVGGTDSIESAFAVSNPSAVPEQVNFELTNLDGTPAGPATSITVPGNGQIQKFLNELPGFANLANPFKGILRITGDAISVLGVRARYNARHDFLLTTNPPTIDSSPSSSYFVFPLLVNGQGYTSQLVLFGESGGQTSTVALKISDQSGQPIGMGLH